MNDFLKPTLEYFELSPLLVVFAVACLGVLVEAFLGRELRRVVQPVLAVVGLLGALVLTVLVGTGLGEHGDGAARGIVGGMGTIVVDGPGVFLWGTILVVSVLGAMLFAERRLDGGVSAFAGQAAALPGTDAERQAASKGLEHTEVYPLMVFSVFGMLMFVVAGDLITLFVALEVLSLPLYLLSGLARRRRLLSQEAALKYFLLGAFSSGFFLYGAALLYGYAGAMDFASIHNAVANDVGNSTMLAIGTGLLAVGLLFKVGAVPFHSWTPDVYQGAPTPVTAFMAAGTKIAAFGAMMRLFYVALGEDRWSWQPMMMVIAVLTMVFGTVLAITQSDVKRLLAYSSVAHTGFILVGVLGLQGAGELGEGQISSTQAVLFYLVSYGFTMLGAFALVGLVRDGGGETSQLERWRGLGTESPVVASVMALLLLSMAGIPLTAGFIGKWAVFSAAASSGAWLVVGVAIVSSVIAIWLYLRVIVVMFSRSGDGPAPSVALPSVLTTVVITVAGVTTVVLGVLPGPVLDLAAHAGEWIR